MIGDRRRARKALERGLVVDKGNDEIMRTLRGMGTRRRPVFPFLDRGHVLNRYTGLAIYRLRQFTQPGDFTASRSSA